MRKWLIRATFLVSCLVAGLLAQGRSAQALPVFARQTGQPCTACHVGGFGPQLTPFGIAFKLGGYTMQGGTGFGSQIPLSAFALTSFTSTTTKQPGGAAPEYAPDNNFALDQISLFLAGRATDYLGGMVQGTYSGVDHSFHLDNTDLRLTAPFPVGGGQLQVGLDVNNGPTVQDPYNTLFAWGFPYVQSSLAPLPAALPLLNGALNGSVIGVTGYAWFNQSFYAEFGAYKSLPFGFSNTLGEAPPPGMINGAAPYLRLAYENQWNGQMAEIGLIGFYAPLSQTATGTPGADTYFDYGIDGTYQFLGSGKHVFSVYGVALQEQQNLQAARAVGTADRAGHQLNELRVNFSYYYDASYGLTLGYQDITGTSDTVLYAPAPITGSRNGSPNSQALIAQVDWTPFGKTHSFDAPWVNLRLGLQYTDYLEFNGGTGNYDGYGRNASGNNTLYAFAWIAF